jgi:hypothetical protein
MDETGAWVDGGNLLRGIEAYKERTSSALARNRA